MDGWLKTLVAGACVVVIAGGGWYARGVYEDGKPKLVVTPRVIAKCEKQIADVILLMPDQQISEMAARTYAIQTHDCNRYGLVSDTQIASIRRGAIGPFLAQYEADQNVWMKQTN